MRGKSTSYILFLYNKNVKKQLWNDEQRQQEFVFFIYIFQKVEMS